MEQPRGGAAYVIDRRVEQLANPSRRSVLASGGREKDGNVLAMISRHPALDLLPLRARHQVRLVDDDEPPIGAASSLDDAVKL